MPSGKTPAPSRGSLIKLGVFLAFVCAAGYLLLYTDCRTICFTPEGRRELVTRIDSWIHAAGVFAPLAFVLLYSVAVLALPATPFTAAGAFIFGKYYGAVLNLSADVLGASIAFLLGRYLLRDFAHHFLTGRLGKLDEKVGRHGFSVIFYLRILWFPFIVLNYAAGATRIRFRDYFWGTLFGILPGVFIVSFFFGSLREIVASWRGPRDLFQFDILVPAALLVFSFFIPGIVHRFRRGRALEEATGANGEG